MFITTVRDMYINPPTLPSLGRGRAPPGTTAGVELCIRKSTKATPITSSNAATVSSHAEDSSYMASESAGWHLELEKRRPASAGPVLAPQLPARPRTAVTSGLKTLAAPQPAQSSSSNGASVASQAQDSSYMDSESDGWHLGLENPRRASAGPVFVQQCRHSVQPRRGQQLYACFWELVTL